MYPLERQRPESDLVSVSFVGYSFNRCKGIMRLNIYKLTSGFLEFVSIEALQIMVLSSLVVLESSIITHTFDKINGTHRIGESIAKTMYMVV